MGKRRKVSLSPTKARKILSHGSVRGKALTSAQRRLMGARASDKPVRRSPKGQRS